MRIAVVGAGPAGAALALLLARNGVEVVLLERETDFERVFRGEGLTPSGIEVLHQMGFRDALAELPGEPFEAWEIHLDRQPVMRIVEPREELGDRALRVVSQAGLLERIIGAAERHDGFRFRPGTTVRDLLRDGDRVRGLRVARQGGEEEVRADLVIGADGRASVVRKRADLELRLVNESYDVLWFKVPLPTPLEDRSPIQIFASGPDGALAYTSWDGRWQIAWMLAKGSWREARERDWLAECAALMPEPLAEHLLSQRAAVDGPSLLDVIVGRCPVWHAPGVLLLGDAAHPMSPVRAQGINMALRDAVVAANHLVPAIRGGYDVDAVLPAIQQEREREVVRSQTLQYRELRGQRWARQRPWLMAPMLRVARNLARFAAVQRFIQWSWLRQQAPLRMGVSEVRLEV
ncbi:MAG: FAD-dependent monooxygenase [Proteobacteria bacterium]|nr:FAD-dependent monooxygenase [Pseudomonadota bacterium]